jgi:hypothetical protein
MSAILKCSTFFILEFLPLFTRGPLFLQPINLFQLYTFLILSIHVYTKSKRVYAVLILPQRKRRLHEISSLHPNIYSLHEHEFHFVLLSKSSLIYVQTYMRILNFPWKPA